MLHTKFRGKSVHWFRRRRFLKGFTIYEHGGNPGHVTSIIFIYMFLAHLSRRLRGELIVYRSSRRPCVRACVCVHTFKHEYLLDLWVDRNQILSEASLGWGIGCIRFWDRLDQNSGFHGNRKLP